MVNMKAFFKLIRWQNLLIIVFTMVLMRYAIIEPVANMITFVHISDTGVESLQLQLKLIDFVILVFAVVTIAAGGYVINDYFDIRTDLINRGDVLVGTKVPRRRAMMWHNILNLAGVAAGFYVSWRIGNFWIGTIFLIVSGLLYFYSSTYKHQLLIGNIIVSLLTATVPFMVAAFEIPPIYNYYAVNAMEMPGINILLYWVLGFSLFAFMTNLIREIIKDMEDFEGDRAYGSRSLPVYAGLKISKIVVITLLAITIVMLVLVWNMYINDLLTIIYIGVAIIIPMIFTGFVIARAENQKDFNRGSFSMKIVMLTGVCYSILVWIIIEKGVLI